MHHALCLLPDPIARTEIDPSGNGWRRRRSGAMILAVTMVMVRRARRERAPVGLPPTW